MGDFLYWLESGALGWTTLSKAMVGEGDDVGTWVGVNIGIMNGFDVRMGDGMQWQDQTREGEM